MPAAKQLGAATVETLIARARQARPEEDNPPLFPSGSRVMNSETLIMSSAIPSCSRSTPMNAVGLIAQESADLPDALQAEVLDFIGYPKTRHPTALVAVARDAKLAELTAFFTPYQQDFGTHAFDRDEANAR